MLQPIIDQLCKNRVVLASQSPRRKELLQIIGFKNIEIIPSNFEEDLNPNDFQSLPEFVEETAFQKVLDVEKRIKERNEKLPAMILGSDTIVTLDGQVFGKPKDKQEAFSILSSLSGRTNTVYTGVVIKLYDKFIKFTDHTNVKFGKLTPERIQEYIETGEPMDKAGGYAIQGYGSTIVESIDGNVHTVVGLPLYKLTNILLENFREQKEKEENQ